MGLHLHRAERADTLAAALAEVLATPLADPFATEIVCVPTRGVERWLAQRLSHRLGTSPDRQDGISAGVAFPSPRRLVAEITDRLNGSAAGQSEDPWQPRRATWPLLRVIDAVRGEPWAELLWSFLGDGPDRPVDGSALDPVRGGRRWWTARHLAGLFARYAGSRPAMIEAWAAGRDLGPDGAPLPPELAWQAELWRRLAADLGRPGPPAVVADAVARLRDDATVPLPARLSIFGATRMEPDQLQIFDALAEHRDVHLWLPHPSPALWEAVGRLHRRRVLGPRADDPTATSATNRLLRSLGRDSRELQLVLAACTTSSSDQHHPPAVVSEPTTLLGRLQADLVADAPPRPAASRPVLDEADRSVSVHACHGPDRQVEVLREVLLGLLADDPTLEPRDVIVMCPDIERFAPLIAAAFGLDTGLEAGQTTAEHPGHRLRVRLADRSLQQLNPLLGVLARLLELADTRLSASAVVDFAAAAPVARRFGFTDDDRERITELVGRSGVRWGLDAEHRAPYGMEAFAQNTWAAGLDRILLGVAMDEQGQHSIGTALPLDDVDSALVDLTGRLAELVDRIRFWTDEFGRRRTVSSWLGLCREAIGSLTSVPRSEQWQSAHAYAELARLADGVVEDTAPGSGADPELSLPEVRAMLAQAVRGRASRSNFRTGTLTVATLLPMRSVPHRVVCLLGVDDGVFPRGTRPDGDDLTAAQPWVGDQDPRSEDRQLLLDAVLAAQERLIIVYGGADNRTGVRRPPAVPVGELLDALDETASAAQAGTRVRDVVTTRHPLQPFHRTNFEPDRLAPGIFSFDPGALGGARAAQGPRRPTLNPWSLGLLPPQSQDAAPSNAGTGVVELTDLIRFFNHPLQHLLRVRAGLAPVWDEELLADRLPIDVGPLGSWAIGDRLLQERLGGADTGRLVAAEWRRGTLPPRAFGGQVITPIATQVDQLATAADAYRDGRPGAADVTVDVVGGTVTATISPLFGNRLVTVGYSTLAAKHRLASWLRLLALTAGRPDEEWRAVTIGRRGTSVLGPVPPDYARLVLGDLLALYGTGLREPVPFMPRTSEQYAALRDRDRSVEVCLPLLERTWAQELDEPWERLLGGKDVATLTAAPSVASEERGTLAEPSRFGTLARRVFHPLLRAEELA